VIPGNQIDSIPLSRDGVFFDLNQRLNGGLLMVVKQKNQKVFLYTK